MFLQRYYLECLSHASYMVADEKTKVAAVIDPRRDIDIYLKNAAEHGFKIKHVILTHFHADFIAGHIELRDQLGAQIYLGKRAEAEFDFEALAMAVRLIWEESVLRPWKRRVIRLRGSHCSPLIPLRMRKTPTLSLQETPCFSVTWGGQTYWPPLA